MNTLVIDTSTKIELIGLSANNNEYSFAERTDISHSATLLNSIDNLLKKSCITINDIELIGVGIGPGSFTGIRIAVSTARMFAQVLRTPLVGIKTHLIYAASLNADKGDRILIAFDARKNRVFGALYKKNDDLFPEEITPPGDYSIDLLLDVINPKARTLCAGDGIFRYIDTVSERLENFIFQDDFLPSGKIACRLIKKIYGNKKENYRDYNKIVPFYARRSDAEIAFEKKKK